MQQEALYLTCIDSLHVHDVSSGTSLGVIRVIQTLLQLQE